MKIVTSVYELNYEQKRSGDIYKSFSLLTLTLRNLIFDEFEYVIYTDKKTYDKYDFLSYFNKPNITIKIVELNSPFYLEKLNPIREKIFNSSEVYDRIYTVKNYIEVILNKLLFLHRESEEDKNTIWLDSGLFGTSCHDGWRDYMVKIAHTKDFLNKIDEKIKTYNFICLRGNAIDPNYLVKSNIKELFDVDVKIIPGGIFGGNHTEIVNVFKDYKSIIESYIERFGDIVSEQEILFILTKDKNVKFFEFDDWLDFQSGILQIMDLMNSEYKREKCYDNF